MEIFGVNPTKWDASPKAIYDACQALALKYFAGTIVFLVLGFMTGSGAISIYFFVVAGIWFMGGIYYAYLQHSVSRREVEADEVRK